MDLLKNSDYIKLLIQAQDYFPYWNELRGKRFIISGASGMLGSFLVDYLMMRNQDLEPEERCHIIAIGRNRVSAERRFKKWLDYKEFLFLSHDISLPLPELKQEIDFFVHAASPADPVAYVAEPINTICANVWGTQNMLHRLSSQKHGRFLLCSSVEIYGDGQDGEGKFKENDCGYLNCNTLRGGYPESKRVSESLCQAYIAEKNIDAVIIRLPRCYGPTMRMTDSKALAQFIKKALAREDIILKSAGNQLYSFMYMVDAVLAILWVLLRGKRGEAYNVGDSKSDITLLNLAHKVSERAGTAVRFETPKKLERSGYSTAVKALLNADKIKKLGWKPYYTIDTGIDETFKILGGEF